MCMRDLAQWLVDDQRDLPRRVGPFVKERENFNPDLVVPGEAHDFLDRLLTLRRLLLAALRLLRLRHTAVAPPEWFALFRYSVFREHAISGATHAKQIPPTK